MLKIWWKMGERRDMMFSCPPSGSFEQKHGLTEGCAADEYEFLFARFLYQREADLFLGRHSAGDAGMLF